eukprot:TRINITY_DN8647_c0_g1_i2.p1 TRINITY_DN8647_c0_g1~~TRINITY_DN8647_c0_g1_i2.p1  ORF type:complete len:543 (-),score=33.82 TRINITY_DN8647_c0_g1_i2:185-1813(-)
MDLKVKTHALSSPGAHPSSQERRAQHSSFSKLGPKVGGNKLPNVFTEIASSAPLRDEVIRSKEVKSSKEFHKVKNPLQPMKEYLRCVKQLEQNNTPTTTDLMKPELNEMITVAQSHGGRFKKVLHAPTLRLYALKETALYSKDNLSSLKSLISKWHLTCTESRYLVRIFEFYWNIPEQHVSILMDLMNGGNFADLLEHFGSIPEIPLRDVFKQSIESIHEVIEKIGYPLSDIEASSFLFDRTGRLRISLGVVLKNQRPQTASHLARIQKIPDNITQEGGVRLCGYLLINIFRAVSDIIGRRRLIFNLGLLFLRAAIGLFDPFNLQGNFSDENICEPFQKSLFEGLGSTHQPCCVIHCMISLRHIITRYNRERDQTRKLSHETIQSLELLSAFLDYVNQIIGQRFSAEFADLICKMTSFSQSAPFLEIDQVLQHPFIKKPSKGAIIDLSLSDLIKSGCSFNQKKSTPSGGMSMPNLERVCQQLTVVLPTCERWLREEENFLVYATTLDHTNNSLIAELASEFGVSNTEVKTRLKGAISCVLNK